MQDQQCPSIISTIVGNYSAMSAWPAPQSRNFAELSDPLIFAEVLEIADEKVAASRDCKLLCRIQKGRTCL